MDNYDNWKQQAPPSYDEECSCKYCGEPLEDGEEFCDSNCKKGYKYDN